VGWQGCRHRQVRGICSGRRGHGQARDHPGGRRRCGPWATRRL